MNITMNPAPPHSPFRDEHALESERTYALFIHIVGLLSVLQLVTGVMSLIGVLIMWRIRRNESPFLDDHGREAMNFQISLLVYAAIGLVLTVVGIGLAILAIGIPLLCLIGCVRGAIAAHRGEFYRYPMCFRFLT